MKLLGMLNVEYNTVLLDNLAHHQVDHTSNDCKVLPISVVDLLDGELDCLVKQYYIQLVCKISNPIFIVHLLRRV